MQALFVWLRVALNNKEVYEGISQKRDSIIAYFLQDNIDEVRINSNWFIFLDYD
jgi:hypothetical protein